MKIIAPLSVSSDSRRRLTNLLQEDIKDINFWEAKRGAILGNHYHKITKEFFLILKGSCIVNTNGERKPCYKGDLFVIEPEVKHSVECLTDLTFMTFLTEQFDEKNPDLYK